MTVVRKSKKRINADVSPEWKIMSEKIKSNECLPVAIGAMYKSSPERCKLEVGEASHYAIFSGKQQTIILDNGQELTDLDIMTDEVLRDISKAYGEGENIVRETALRQIVTFCEALIEDMGLPLRHNRVQVDLLVDFGVAIKKNKIVPVLGTEDGFQLSLTFRIPTAGMDTQLPKEELRSMQDQGIAAFSRMAVTLLQFRTDKEAEVEMVAVGHGIYLFNLKMNLSRLFLDYARQKNAKQQFLDFTSKPVLDSFAAEEEEDDIDVIVARWFRQLRTVNFFAIKSNANIEKKLTIRPDDFNLTLNGLWMKERGKRVGFNNKGAENLDYNVWV